jgi:hypothetical protein
MLLSQVVHCICFFFLSVFDRDGIPPLFLLLVGNAAAQPACNFTSGFLAGCYCHLFDGSTAWLVLLISLWSNGIFLQHVSLLLVLFANGVVC